jgi:acetyltransferase-like isoleucine patch superfamily enzyme
MEGLAPIVVFVFNRPKHTQLMLNALANNVLAKDSELFIYADGAKENASEKQLKAIQEVHQIISNINGFKNVTIIKRTANFGLAANIAEGVSEVVNKFGKVIVLEDDIRTAPYFLTYMNNALNLYQNEERVMHISGYMYPNAADAALPETFCYNVPLCWGWATWDRAWKNYNDDAVDLWKQLFKLNNWKKYDAFGGQYLSSQLAQNISGKIKTWFVKWHSSVFLLNGLTIYPKISLVDNIGFDDSGENNKSTNVFNVNKLAEQINVERIALEINQQAEKVFKDFYTQFTVFKPSLKNKIIDWFKYQYSRVVNKLLPNYKLIVSQSLIYKSYLGIQVQIYPYAKITHAIIGSYTYVSDNAVICNAIIGKFCSIGPNLICGWGIHPLNGISTHPMFYSINKQNGITLTKANKVEEVKLTIIGNDVFIGMNVTILDGVTVGHGAVIGAGSVVTKDIPPYAIAVGVPAKVIGNRFDDQTIEKLLEKKWWDDSFDKLKEVEKHFFDLNSFLNTNKN